MQKTITARHFDLTDEIKVGSENLLAIQVQRYSKMSELGSGVGLISRLTSCAIPSSFVLSGLQGSGFERLRNICLLPR